MGKIRRVPVTHGMSFLGTETPQNLSEGTEVTCTEGRYYLDPGHKRTGYHLVAIGGELYEISKRLDFPSPPSSPQVGSG